MISSPQQINQLTETIIGCAIEVHKTLGAGLLESVYRECMVIEMTQAQLRCHRERHIKLMYKGVPINSKRRSNAFTRFTWRSSSRISSWRILRQGFC